MTPEDSVPDEGTMQLRPEPQDAAPVEPGTVRLGRAPVPPVSAPAPAPEVTPTPTVRVPVQAPAPEQPAAATAPPAAAPPAPAAAGTPAATPAPDPGLIRFGPGVPDPKTARTIAVWKGEARPAAAEEEEKKRNPWLFWVPVIALFLALLGWWLYGFLTPASLKITAASVKVAPTSLTCNGKATLTATVTTDGSGGTFKYRWRRSDGTDSGWLTETVAAGTRTVQLPLIWTLSGPGTFDGQATLEIEDHPAFTETGAFTYSCQA